MRDPDELAGVVDLFGGLTRDELERALRELAFRDGDEAADADVADAVEAARRDLALVAVERDGDDLLVPGPTAFPVLPDGGEDLPHILDVTERDVDRAVAGRAAAEHLRGQAARAAAAGDVDRMEHLLDATYDLEAWADVDAGDVRERLDDALETARSS